MSLETQFRSDLGKVLEHYETSNQFMSLEDAQTITKIKLLLTDCMCLLKLHQKVVEVVQQIPGRFFSFLPFIRDLKRELQNILSLPQYSLTKIFMAESIMLREENTTLRAQLEHFGAQSYQTQSMPPVKDLALYQKIETLEKEFMQANQLLRTENAELTQAVAEVNQQNAFLEEINRKLRANAENTETKLKELQIELLEKDAELIKLRAENETLKNLIHKQKQQYSPTASRLSMGYSN